MFDFFSFEKSGTLYGDWKMSVWYIKNSLFGASHLSQRYQNKSVEIWGYLRMASASKFERCAIFFRVCKFLSVIYEKLFVYLCTFDSTFKE